MSDSLDYFGLTELLQRVGYAEPPSGFHGILCGALCAQSAEEIDPASLLDDGVSRIADPEDLNTLLQLRDATCAALLSDEMSFAPLLPEDEMPLSARVEQLAAWCGGFLYGLSSRRKLDLRECSEEARETLRDLSQFTQAGLDSGGDPETEEAAYAELVEYLRIGAQLLFLELRPRPPSVDSDYSTVH